VLMRELGDLRVSLLGLGTSRLASLGARHSDADISRLLDTATDMGVNFIDTADTYGSGACERRLGELLSRRKDRFHIATKGGFCFVDLPRPLRFLNQFGKKGLQLLGRHQDFSPAVIARRIEKSLRRLRVEAIDLYFLHEVTLLALRNEELIDVIFEARKQGKVRNVGVSSSDKRVLEAAAEIAGVTAVQTAVNPFPGNAFEACAPLLDSAGVGVVANGVLLSGRTTISAAASVSERSILMAAEIAARDRGLTVPGVLIRQAASQSGVRVVLTGTSDPRHLRENAESLTGEITGADRLLA
jgi:aryl-alcohol dehydrogenase-like predicted oxidoreductase